MLILRLIVGYLLAVAVSLAGLGLSALWLVNLL
jgi:hypothetical protein